MRPAFHFTAPGWINDPHGIVWRDGRYHAFFQHVPDSTEWRLDCRWGHATGPDLLSLTAGADVLDPGDGDDGIWTGSLVVDDAGGATILYTAVSADDLDAGRIRLAHPRDPEWTSWAKGPVVLTPPTDLDLFAFRDPFVWREDGRWRMLVGAGLQDGTALALGYHGDDLEHWEADGVVAERSRTETEGAETGALWECPQLVAIGDHHVLVFSVWTDHVLYGAGYGVGRMVEGRFEAETWGRLSFGDSYYAPSFYRDADGRPCLLFWMRGVADAAEGWSGAHSIPYLLAIEDGRLVAAPHPDLDRYLGEPLEGAALPSAAHLRWHPAAGDALRIAHGGGELLALAAEDDAVALTTPAGESRMPWSGGALRIVLDGPLVEVVGADGVLGGPVPATGHPLALHVAGAEPEVRPLRR